jgi:putative inorganic carbon (HCO3(-)) transporter
LVPIIGSLRHTLEAFLIFTFSMNIHVHIGYSERYRDVRYGVPITTLDAVILVALYAVLGYQVLLKARRINLFPTVTVPLLCLIVWSALSSLWSPKPDYALYQLGGLIEMFFLFLYAGNCAKSEHDLAFYTRCVAFTVSVSSLVAIYQFATGTSWGFAFLGMERAEEVMSVQAGVTRAAGFLGHPNGLAWFLTQWLPLLIIFGIMVPRSKLRSVCLLSSLLGFFGLVFTFSRAGWLAFAVSIVLIFICFIAVQQKQKAPRHNVHRLAALLISSAIVGGCLSPVIILRLTGGDEGAAYSRVPLALVALNTIKHNPVLGVGLGNYEYVMEKYDNTPERIATPPNKDAEALAVHNIYLLLAAELGIPALLVFLLLSLHIIKKAVSLLRSQRDSLAFFGAALLVGLLAFYAQALVQPGGIGTTRFRPFWFMCGLVFACSRLANDRESTSKLRCVNDGGNTR